MCAGLKRLDVKFGVSLLYKSSTIVLRGDPTRTGTVPASGDCKGQNHESYPECLHTNEVGIDMQINNMPREG